MMKKKLSFRQTILVASTLFGMFFGAGNLIFPVHLGQMAGRNVWGAVLGFIVTAVSIPILGVAAIGLTRSDDMRSVSSRVSRRYGYVFTCALYLTIGPFFAIPRCATTSFTVGVSPLLGSGSQALGQLIFTLLFFGAVLFFSLRPSGIMTWIGRIINPVFLIFLSILVCKALAAPGAAVASVAPVESYESGAFFNGFIEGYGTMDAIAGLAFGVVVIDVIRSLGVTDPSDIAREAVRSGGFTALLMALIYILTILMGAQSRGLFDLSENGGVALAQLSGHYLGNVGSIVLALTITFACLKTAIGLVTSCASIFVRMFPRTLRYNGWAILFTVFSACVSNVGLTALIRYSLPTLMLLYPLCITLILLALCDKLFHGRRSVYVGVTAGAFIAAIFDFARTLPESVIASLHLSPAISLAGRVLPFFSLGLGWVVPALIGLALGLFWPKKSA